ncbi:hypothetical protein D3C80_1221020 [compost metagenome]
MDTVDDRVEIATPDIASVNDAERKHLISARFAGNFHKLVCPTHEIDMQTCNRQRKSGFEIVAQFSEIGRSQDFDRACYVQTMIGKFKSCTFIGDEIENQRWLVNLHPIGSGFGQFLQ